MKIEGLMPLRSSIDQAITSLYFLRIFNSFCSSSSVNAANITLVLPFLVLRKHTSDDWAILSISTPLYLFLVLLLSFPCYMIFLYCFQSNSRLFLCIATRMQQFIINTLKILEIHLIFIDRVLDITIRVQIKTDRTNVIYNHTIFLINIRL